MRHGTSTKYAKNLKRFRNMDDQETRDAYHQAVLDRQALTKRTQKVGDDSDSSDISDDDMSGDLEEKAIDEMKAVLNEDGADEDESESDSEDDGAIKMDFSSKAKGGDNKKKVEQGIFGMKFM